jgi:hypothetical protein
VKQLSEPWQVMVLEEVTNIPHPHIKKKVSQRIKRSEFNI